MNFFPVQLSQVLLINVIQGAIANSTVKALDSLTLSDGYSLSIDQSTHFQWTFPCILFLFCTNKNAIFKSQTDTTIYGNINIHIPFYITVTGIRFSVYRCCTKSSWYNW